MVPSSDAQAMELDPWQKTNAFIFQPANRPRRVSLNNSQAYKINTLYDNMVSSVSGLDEANPVLWLVTRAGKMALLGITRCVPQQNYLSI